MAQSATEGEEFTKVNLENVSEVNLPTQRPKEKQMSQTGTFGDWDSDLLHTDEWKVILQNSRKWTALSVDQGEKKMKSFLWTFWDLTAFVFEAEKAAEGWDRVQCHLLKELLCFVEGTSAPLIMAKELFSPERGAWLQLHFSLSENDHSAWLTVL